jgi:hypothetical protein
MCCQENMKPKKSSCKTKLQTLKLYKSYMFGVNSNNHYSKKQLTPIVSIIFKTFYIWLYLNMSTKSVVDNLCHIAWISRGEENNAKGEGNNKI